MIGRIYTGSIYRNAAYTVRLTDEDKRWFDPLAVQTQARKHHRWFQAGDSFPRRSIPISESMGSIKRGQNMADDSMEWPNEIPIMTGAAFVQS